MESPRQPRHEASIDVARPHQLLSHDPKRVATLEYRYTDTNEVVTCPNIWYNQPFETRLDALSFQAEQIEASVRKLQDMPPILMTAEDLAATSARMTGIANRLRDIAKRVKDAADPAFPVAASRLSKE